MKSSSVVIFICSGFMLSGGTILGIGLSWNLMRMSYYFWTSDLGVELGSGVLIIAACLLCLPTIRLTTLVPYYVRSFTIPATLMFLATASLLLLCSGLSSLVELSRTLRDPQHLNASMRHAMSLEPYNAQYKVAFGAMQRELKCCGATSEKDWFQHRTTLPPSCCGRDYNSNNKINEPCQSSFAVFRTGCLKPALAELRSHVNTCAVLASFLIFVMTVTLFVTAYILIRVALERWDTARAPKSQPFTIARPSQFVPLQLVTMTNGAFGNSIQPSCPPSGL